MDASTITALKDLRSLAVALKQLPLIGAEAYANGKADARPIVEAHFTPGNDQRNGWPPLSRDYALRKASGLKKNKRGIASELQTLATGRRVKIDRAASFTSSTGTLAGIGAMANLPMLVRSGLLRERVTSRTLHQISVSGDTATIVFSGLPDYAKYLHTGTDGKRKMPPRSPVRPSFEDITLVENVMRRHLDAAKGGTKGVPVSGKFIGPLARSV